MQNDASSQPWARYTWSMLQSQEILEAALQLPQEQREVLVDKLAASLELGDLGEYWEGEIQRRIQDVDAGRVATIPADEVFARLEQRFVPN